jgi:high-affinity iron transporter
VVAPLPARSRVQLHHCGDTSWLLKDDSLLGRLLHTLIGYPDQPNGAQLGVYRGVIVVIVGLMRLVRRR